MKKLFTTFFLSVAFISFIFSQEIVKPTIIKGIIKATAAITLDADDAEADWADATEISLDSGDVANTEGFAATLKVTWDDNYFYLLVKASDVNQFEYDGADSWKKDGVQVYFDVRDELVVGQKVSTRQHTIALCYGMTIDNMDAGAGFMSLYKDNTLATYADLMTDITSDGWIIEARIPIATLYYNGDDVIDYESCVAAKTIGVGDTLGFAIQANNYNADIATPDRTAVVTYPGGGDTWTNSSLWGGLQLLAGGVSINNTIAASVKLYPNPVFNELTVELDGLKSVEIIDIAGKILMQQVASSNSLTLNVSALESGLYFIRMNGSDNFVQKVIKK